MITVLSAFRAALHHQHLLWSYRCCNRRKGLFAVTRDDEVIEIFRPLPGHIWSAAHGTTLPSSAIRTIFDAHELGS